MALHNVGITELFRTQVAVWHETIGPGSFERDLCIESPTGTGKTISYVLPIVQMLSTRKVKCLRAQVVVHTRILADQIKRVFDKFAPAVGLSVGLAVGQSSIEDEISSLIKKPGLDSSIFDDPGYICQEPRSSVDILVATPGRLMEHVNNTNGFTLEHLQYLVVDEADRLLRESYQSWLITVLQSAYTRNLNQFPVADNILPTFGSLRTIRSFGVKIVLSATITDNPGKMAPLDLHHPLLLTTDQRLPEQLKSYKVDYKSGLKQLYPLALLESLQGENCIVFTSSPRSADELCTLLNSLDGLQIKIGQYSSEKHPKKRNSSEKQSIKKMLSALGEGKIQVLISHNELARGIHIEGLKNVINYDTPESKKNYIHQAGRTARAGNTGRCFTFLDKDKVKLFKRILQDVGIESCPFYPIPSESVESSLRHRYSAAAEKHRKGKPFLLRCMKKI